MTLTTEPAQLVTHGWQPGANVRIYRAAHQEAARQNGLPPTQDATLRIAAADADAAGTLDVTVPSNVPLLLYGQRLDARDPKWMQSMAQPNWQTPSNQ